MMRKTLTLYLEDLTNKYLSSRLVNRSSTKVLRDVLTKNGPSIGVKSLEDWYNISYKQTMQDKRIGLFFFNLNIISIYGKLLWIFCCKNGTSSIS